MSSSGGGGPQLASTPYWLQPELTKGTFLVKKRDSVVKNPPANADDMDSIPDLGRPHVL